MPTLLKCRGSKDPTPGREVPLPPSGEFTIGRKESCDLEYSGDSMISARHIKLIIQSPPDRVWLQDYSSNGAFINDTRVGKGNKVELKNGDVIAFLKPWDPPNETPPYAFQYIIASAEVAESEAGASEFVSGGLLAKPAFDMGSPLLGPTADDQMSDFHVPTKPLPSRGSAPPPRKPQTPPVQQYSARQLATSLGQTHGSKPLSSEEAIRQAMVQTPAQTAALYAANALALVPSPQGDVFENPSHQQVRYEFPDRRGKWDWAGSGGAAAAEFLCIHLKASWELS